MSSLCKFLNCHNLGSSNYQGYCNQHHMDKAKEYELLYKIMESKKEISTLAEARKYLNSILEKKSTS